MTVLFVVGIFLLFASLTGGLAFGLAGGVGGTDSAPSPQSEDNTPSPGRVIGANMISHDPKTWPRGDAIWNIARAIAMAEGANNEGSVPDRLNNPGDISDGGKTFGYEAHSGSNVTTFPDKEVGWSWLRSKLQNIQNGRSRVYFPTMTWWDLGRKWAGDWENWVVNVTRNLGVDPTSTFRDYTG